MDLKQYFRSKKSVNLNSIWKKLERTGFKFYCISCHRERLLSVPARAGSFQFFLHVFFTTAFLMLISWPLFHWKGFVLFIPVWAVFEMVSRMKMRALLVCPDCDFDPALYLVDRDQAVQRVENVWRKKFERIGHPFPERTKNGRLRHRPVSDHFEAVEADSAENPAPETGLNAKTSPAPQSPETRA